MTTLSFAFMAARLCIAYNTPSIPYERLRELLPLLSGHTDTTPGADRLQQRLLLALRYLSRFNSALIPKDAWLLIAKRLSLAELRSLQKTGPHLKACLQQRVDKVVRLFIDRSLCLPARISVSMRTRSSYRSTSISAIKYIYLVVNALI